MMRCQPAIREQVKSWLFNCTCSALTVVGATHCGFFYRLPALICGLSNTFWSTTNSVITGSPRTRQKATEVSTSAIVTECSIGDQAAHAFRK